MVGVVSSRCNRCDACDRRTDEQTDDTRLTTQFVTDDARIGSRDEMKGVVVTSAALSTASVLLSLITSTDKFLN